MTQEQLIQLARIYNTLLTVNVNGENILTMADCLRAFQKIMDDLTKDMNSENKDDKKE